MNVASRLAAHSQPSRIHLSSPTVALIGDVEAVEFPVEPRGLIELKVVNFTTGRQLGFAIVGSTVVVLQGRGMMLTYWLITNDRTKTV